MQRNGALRTHTRPGESQAGWRRSRNDAQHNETPAQLPLLQGPNKRRNPCLSGNPQCPLGQSVARGLGGTVDGLVTNPKQPPLTPRKKNPAPVCCFSFFFHLKLNSQNILQIKNITINNKIEIFLSVCSSFDFDKYWQRLPLWGRDSGENLGSHFQWDFSGTGPHFEGSLIFFAFLSTNAGSSIPARLGLGIRVMIFEGQARSQPKVRPRLRQSAKNTNPNLTLIKND